MKIAYFSKKQIIIVLLGLMIIMCILVYFCRGVIRIKVLPRVSYALYGRTTSLYRDNEYEKLKPYLEAVGITSVELSPTKCYSEWAEGFEQVISCDANMYKTVSLESNDRQQISSALSNLHDHLKRSGLWQTHTDDFTFLTTDMYGQDRVFGATYYNYPKMKYHETKRWCYLHFSSDVVPYAGGLPKELDFKMSCKRKVTIIGNQLD